MVDLISRAALLEFAHNHVNGIVDCNDIARFPAVDAEPVQHGHWIAPDDSDGITACICSICDWHGHIMEDDGEHGCNGFVPKVRDDNENAG